MDNTPILTPTGPRFAPPRMHVRNASQSPTRKRFADDLLSDLSPATTLEAFTNPSGKLKASVEAATPSERAFGIRATIASKNIQEWVDELSDWPWPSEGGSVGFEMPATKRRKLSDPFVDHNSQQSYEKSGMTNGDEPQYIGSLLADEVDRYEDRIDEIQSDMEELNVEDIKRQVLDTHFSPRSRPSSSASNAPPMPQFLSSYTKMDDFTAVVTSTVLQSLPNLSRLMRLIDVWSIRLSVLRKVPPLLLALEDAEIALKSGWNAIRNPTEPDGLSRETFDVMRGVLRNKVTKLGRDLDFLLDTLEGRPDTLPDNWLDRMEVIENDYGSWDVAGDRKVREGEWAKLAKKRKEEEEARKLREAEEAEVARRKAEQEVREEAERLALQKAEDDARRQAEREAQEAQEAETARLRAIQETEDAARLKAQMEAEALEAARLKAECEAAAIEEARALAEREAEAAARRQVEQEAQNLARRKGQEEEEANLKAEQEAAHSKALKEAEDAAIRQAQLEAELAEKARLKAEQEARDLAQRQAEEESARKRAQREAEQAEAARRKGVKDAEDEAIRKAQLEAKIAEAARVKAEQEASDIARREAEEAAARKAQQDAEELEKARLEAEKEAQEAASRQARLDAEAAEAARLQAQRESEEQARFQAEKEAFEAKLAEQHAVEARATEARLQAEKVAAKSKANEEAEGAERARLQSQRKSEEALSAEAIKQHIPEDAPLETVTKQMKTEADPDQLDKETQALIAGTDTRGTEDESSRNAPGCPTCAEIQDSDESASLRTGSRVAMGSSTSRPSSPKSPFDVLKSSILGYASYDGIDDGSPSVLPTSDETRLEQDPDLKKSVLDSPIHFDDGHAESPATASPARSTAVGSEEPKTPQSQKIPRVGHAFANALLRTSTSPQSSTLESPQSSSSPQAVNDQNPEFPKTPIFRPLTPVKLLFPKDGAEDLLRSKSAISTKSNEDGWVVIGSSDEEDAQASEPDMSKTDSSQGSPTIPRDSASSVRLGYFTTDPTPEIQEAEPAGYFQPVLSPIKGSRSPITDSAPVTPLKSPAIAPELAFPEVLPILDAPTSPGFSFLSRPGLQALRAKSASPSLLERGGDECESCDSLAVEPEIARPSSVPVLAHKQSISRISTDIRRISIARRGSTSSEASTVINGRAGDSPSSPVASSITSSPLKSFEHADASPSAGRIGHRIKKSYDFSPPDSPGQGARLSPQRSLQILKSPNLSPPDPNTPSTPIEAPSFDDLDVTTTSIISSPKKATTDEQIQQQISSLLETIPARIRLTSEPTSSPFTSQTVRPKKARRSITPNARPSSTMSNYSTSTTYSRAATPGPQFTLAPAFGKTSQRTRTHNGNPEIKLYHLSRSGGEAPIKLFVRLVGEHGERVMVRVGGGWADLGEYLKEYASHHGRRSAADTGDKVEIQDLPPRIVSNSSTISTMRGSGRDTPVPRPFSVLERERPSSSLNVRKTRKSIGDNDPSSQLRPCLNDTRSPSTPLPLATRRVYETPPSVAASAASSTSSNGRSSRMSWTEEDSSLGLAGPKSKKVVISERDQEWVESMKEKVRLASAEKEKKERERERKASFGEMDKVGGTKRLFRKG